MMMKIMVITKMKFTRSMTRECFQEWAADSQADSQVEVRAADSQVEVRAADSQAEVRAVDSQAEVRVADSQEDSKAEELQHHRRHLSLLKNPRHQPLRLIQEESEGACTDTRMCG